MVLVDAHPWLTGTRTEQQSQGRPETKTPRAAKRAGEAVDGSDKSSRVSSGSTLKSRAKKTHKQSKLARQMTRSVSSFGEWFWKSRWSGLEISKKCNENCNEKRDCIPVEATCRFRVRS